MSLVGIQWKFPNWEGLIKKAIPEIQLFVAAQIQHNRAMLFDSEGAYNGHQKWKPLLLRNGMILSNRGALRRSIAPQNPKGVPGPDGIVRIAGDTITVGTKLIYARLMNDGTVKMPGGVLKPVRAKALAIPLPDGKKATGSAKELRKESVGREELQKGIERLEKRVASARSPEVKQELEERLERYRKRLEDSPKDQRVIFRKSVKIPPRPFDTWTDADQNELQVALRNKLVEVLQKG